MWNQPIQFYQVIHFPKNKTILVTGKGTWNPMFWMHSRWSWCIKLSRVTTQTIIVEIIPNDDSGVIAFDQRVPENI